MIWTSIQLGYLHFTVYNLSYHAYIHYLLFHTLLPVILRYSLAQGRPGTLKIRDTCNCTPFIIRQSHRLANRNSITTGPRLQFGNKNRKFYFHVLHPSVRLLLVKYKVILVLISKYRVKSRYYCDRDDRTKGYVCESTTSEIKLRCTRAGSGLGQFFCFSTPTKP